MPRRIPTHRPPGARPPEEARRERNRDYSRTRRDPEAQAFYTSAAWRKLRLVKLRRDPLCEACRREGRLAAATDVHHLAERRDRPDLALDLDNLEAVCKPCHNRVGKSKGGPTSSGPPGPTSTGSSGRGPMR